MTIEKNAVAGYKTKNTRKHRYNFGLLLCLAFISVVACTKKEGSGNKAQGNSFTINLKEEPTTLNPITSTDLYARDVQSYTQESLLTRDEDTYNWKPSLAEKWEVSPDGKIFTFFLRNNAKWHDGKLVTIDDVKFSFDVIFDNRFNTAPQRPYYEGIEKVEVTPPNVIKFFAKNKYFGNFESAAGLTVQPKHIYQDPEAKGLNKTIVGSGPYKMESYDQGQRIVLIKNPDYWGAAEAKARKEYNFQRIIMRFVKADEIALEMLKKGELDFHELTPEQYMKKTDGPEWGKSVIKVKYQNKAPKPYGYIGWNFNKDLFKDKSVRIALAHLMNRKLMIEKFRYGLAEPATGPWHKFSEYANPGVKAIEYDPKAALELFKKAGWSDSDKDGILDKKINGKKVNFKFQILFANEESQKYLTMYKEDAKQAGVDIDLKLVEWNTLLKLLDEKNFDAINLGWGGGSVDLDPKQIWHSASATKGGSNFIDYKNPEVDKMIEEARETIDKAKRIPLLQKVYEAIANDAPYLFMFNDTYGMYGHAARIKKPKDTFIFTVGTGFWFADSP